jgi:hypothetical protein
MGAVAVTDVELFDLRDNRVRLELRVTAEFPDLDAAKVIGPHGHHHSGE